ncbi:hypothetical protein WBO78_00335 [Bosea sp. CCNWLW174]|uniref:hypothetical protein n=1 Tax=unclassified Bosea (in: a-proteobacteria) TaxID=2653178 RepID=UPI00301429BD
MKTLRSAIALSLFCTPLLIADAMAAKRTADDPRRKCREAIQKSQGLGKDAKVSRKAIDRCVANGGQN